MLKLFVEPKSKSIALSAQRWIEDISKECAVKKAIGEKNPTFNVPKKDPQVINRVLDQYTFRPANGDCNGDGNNLLTVVSRSPSIYPTFSYNVETGEKTCSHDGPIERLPECSARRNGEW